MRHIFLSTLLTLLMFGHEHSFADGATTLAFDKECFVLENITASPKMVADLPVALKAGEQKIVYQTQRLSYVVNVRSDLTPLGKNLVEMYILDLNTNLYTAYAGAGFDDDPKFVSLSTVSGEFHSSFSCQ